MIRVELGFPKESQKKREAARENEKKREEARKK
jgi:hypothetical protein